LQRFAGILGITEEKGELNTEGIAKLLESVGGKGKGRKADEMLDELVAIRETARKNKDYALSDKIRKELEAIGVLLEDKKSGGTGWKIRS
jgi:cysteinyl-tRNA synthetase